MQFTYGIGAIGGGLGRKRLLEFVSFCGTEHAPYFRFLHEDAMGNTIATTSLWGDRLDEYDYTDYGAPIHAPVALDGRWISGMSYNGNDVTTVTLIAPTGSRLAANSLLGCEVRVARRDAPNPDSVFETGWVISQYDTTLTLRDPDGYVAAAWADSASGDGAAEARASAAIYDLRQGYLSGVMDAASNGTWMQPGPWQGTPCTYVTVNTAPFDLWMATPSPTASYQRWVTLDDGTTGISARIIEVTDLDAGHGYKTLVVEGRHAAPVPVRPSTG